MPRIERPESGKKRSLAVPIVLGGAVLAGVGGWWLWRRHRTEGGPGPGPGAVLVASTAPGQPEIS